MIRRQRPEFLARLTAWISAASVLVSANTAASAAAGQILTSARATVVTWTGCQFRFSTNVGNPSTLRVIVASAEVTVRVPGGG
jgi:hypothetical protein